LIDDQLSAELLAIAGQNDQAKRIVIRKWLDWEESTPPFKVDQFTYHDFTSYLSSNVRSNGIPYKGKVYMNKRSILRNVFDRVVETLGVPTVTPKGRRRHLERMKWATYLINMPNKCRPRRGPDSRGRLQRVLHI
jgi:hypothetical protein